ncbi:hypothetical protein NIES4073_17080 [Kalymmatonema gypsitolerans NIES-4073]|uniref:hypothetical protein n=1 Tax=Scytonema sp. PRP1 TaxID=3120513 RepID=UPI000B5F7160|nr:hypothetical protein NIES4073_17080 [Scytonema sp. NIES-4073]
MDNFNKKSKTYAQKYAQDLLIKFLREEAKFVGYDAYVKSEVLPTITWRVNRDAPYWGIFPDYPIAKSENTIIEIVWDEYLFNTESTRKDAIPTIDELWNFGLVLETVLDIAIQHKGVIHTAVFFDEIPNHAINFLKTGAIPQIVVVNSYDLLNQPLFSTFHGIKMPIQILEPFNL